MLSGGGVVAAWGERAIEKWNGGEKSGSGLSWVWAWAALHDEFWRIFGQTGRKVPDTCLHRLRLHVLGEPLPLHSIF